MNYERVNGRYIKIIWLYLLLLIFEGAIRRWILPSLSTPLLVVRDPIVIGLVLIAIQRGWLQSSVAILIMFLSTISFIATLLVGHQNLLTDIYGWRIYFFYVPFSFLVGKLLTMSNLLKIGRFILYLSIPMTLLIIIQFYSPQSAWVNRGVGGDLEGAGFSGALGYFRPPGTFSFTAGYVCYQLLVGCFLFYFLLMNALLPIKERIGSLYLGISVFCYIITIPFSISRTHFFQTIVLLLFAFIGAFFREKSRTRLLLVSFIIFFFLIVFLNLNASAEGLSAFTDRFDSASQSEGGIEGTLLDRYIGAIGRGLDDGFPFWGYGLGFGTNVGAKLLGYENMYSKFNSDQEWTRVFGECGFLIGISIMFLRMYFSLWFFRVSWLVLKIKGNVLPWIFAPAIFITFAMGQFNATSNLGFAVLITGFGLASLKGFKNKEII